MGGFKIKIRLAGRAHVVNSRRKCADLARNAGKHSAELKNRVQLDQGGGGKGVGASLPQVTLGVRVAFPSLRRASEQLDGSQRHRRQLAHRHDEREIRATGGRVQPRGAAAAGIAKFHAVPTGALRHAQVHAAVAKLHRTALKRE